MRSRLNEHQRMAVEALENLKGICDKHHLTLYLLAGTTLGAVRHQGMIPWDDDIDVGLTYKDWYKLRAILPEELNSKFEYMDYDVKKDFPRLFGKILYNRRNCVDVFLIAKWTSNSVFGNLHWQIRRMAQECYKFSLNYTTPQRINLTKKDLAHIKKVRFMRKIIYKVVKPFFSREDYIRLAKWNESYYEKHPSDCYINLYSIYKMEKERIRAEWIENTSMVEFEGQIYTTVGDTDAYLTHLYGDYMTPPPVDKRQALHGERF